MDAFPVGPELSAEWRDFCLSMLVNASMAASDSVSGRSTLAACTAVKLFVDNHVRLVWEDEAREVARLAVGIAHATVADGQGMTWAEAVTSAMQLIAEARKQVAEVQTKG